YFYLTARHPWFPRADAETRMSLQDPAYRYGRPLYPLLAGFGGTLSAWGTLAGLIVVQILAGGLYTLVVRALARQNGLPISAAVVGVLNPALFFSAVLLTSDMLATALILWGLLAWQRGRLAWAVGLFAAAVFAKEYYALTPLTLGCILLFQHRGRTAAIIVGGSLIPFVVWKLAVWSVLGPGEAGGNFTWPGEGIRAAAKEWSDVRDLGALAIFVVLIALASAGKPSQSLPRWLSVVWGLLGLITSSLVWADPADALRVLAPLWWFVIWVWWPGKVTSVCRPLQPPTP
ncbi:MAG TPA: hypothetical protein VGJ05_22600, partial [Fimbriiglobus sp.]